MVDPHAVDYGRVAPLYQPRDLFPVHDDLVAALHVVAPVAGLVYVTLADGLAPEAVATEHVAARLCYVWPAVRRERFGVAAGKTQAAPHERPYVGGVLGRGHLDGYLAPEFLATQNLIHINFTIACGRL